MNTFVRRNRLRGALSYQNLEPRQLLAGLPIITEFLASNSDGIIDDNGDTSDWIEIYNAGDADINLGGYTLTDDADNPDRWTFPSTVLEQGEFLVVRAATDAAPTQGSEFFTGFGLSAGGEYVGLYDAAGDVLSEFGIGGTDYPTQYSDVSYGVEFDGNFDQVSYFSTPTPGAANTNAVAGVTERVEASVVAGFHESSFQVSLSTDTPGALIGYTTDGSTPTPANATLYNGPVDVSSTTTLRAASFRPNFLSAPDRTWSYFFVDDIVNQSNDGTRPSDIYPEVGGSLDQEFDYGFDPDVFLAEGERVGLAGAAAVEAGREIVKDALLAIPSWSITTDVGNLFDEATGIYTNASEDGNLWERAASVEQLNPDGSEGFQVNAGLRIRGASSRSDSNPKHSFKLFFRGEYGDSTLDYDVFKDTPGTATSFERIDLRTAQNYSWSKDGDSDNVFVTDVFNRQNQQALGQPSTHSSWVHLYLNGQYWGLYQTQERVDADFAESYFGGDADDYDVIKADADGYRERGG